MRIPEVRKELLEIASNLEGFQLPEVAERLRELEKELHRRKRSVRTPPKSKHVTPRTQAQIRAFKKANPDMSHQEIAVAMGVNSGRVSEALIGKRT